MVQMNNSDIPFETEAELRVRGTAKTPDILLSCPVGIRVRKRNELASASASASSLNDGIDDDMFEWKIICWIDSKVRTMPLVAYVNVLR
jgi:hypothetical protein